MSDDSSARRRFAQALNAAVLRAEKRLGQGINRVHLGKRINVARGTIYNYLNGSTVPGSSTLDRLIAELGVTGPEAGRLGNLRDAAEMTKLTERGKDPAPVQPRQLPTFTSCFTGRAAELARLDHNPITTIDGTAGVGKTTLALCWAHRATERFPDGQLYFDLRGFGSRSPMDPAQVLHRFLEAFGVAAESIPDDLDAKAARYRSLLSGKRVLVVLDNASSADQVRPLLPGSRACGVIITSRQRLDSLVALEGAHRVGLDPLSPGDSVTMLAECLGADRLRGQDDAVAELAHLCAGLPLALAVVAARAAALPTTPVRSLVTELRRERLDLLTPGNADLDLRSLFHWSCAVLPDSAQHLFRLLGSHPGPTVDRWTAAALLGTTGAPRTELAALSAANLVTEPTIGRYAMHDLLRVYARELAETDPGSLRAATRRALDHHLAAATLANEHLQPCSVDQLRQSQPAYTCTLPTITDYDRAVAWFVDELPALLSMIEHAAANGFESHAWRLAWACTVFLRRSGRRADRAKVHRTALAAAQRAGDAFAHATTLRLLGDAVARLGQRHDAVDLLQTSMAEFHALGHDDGVRQAHLSLARVYDAQRRHTEALDHAENALLLATKTPDGLALADGLTSVAKQNCALGDYTDALAHGVRALALYRGLGHTEGEADVLMHIAYAELRSGRPEDAILTYERSLELDRRLGDRYWEAHALDRLADIRASQGDMVRSRELRVESLAILDELWHPDAVDVRRKLDADDL
ncbi:tetratricopeptide repeat protein [Lentzea sp. BCCO 10_0061]|uniref:Tetratricopeptide repeat protein n=1 Tax=Lentzea sokolovensis TaxID=3095429 RepID=A0ABU4URB3_9PSEU|nr:NB-ARC domain-containing protein [Lentzea sp. BCCO 10_0061]MDX8141574.1 tetratricopeptide repeat protein [Lentzea sp. BCCO 10_0061]